MNDLKILLVEDSMLDAELLIETLVAGGINRDKICHVVEKEDLIKQIEASVFSLVITDYNLVSYTALDVIEILRSHNKDYPVICVTGMVGEEKTAGLFKAGITDYLLKDNIDRVMHAVETSYDNYKKQKQIDLMQNQIKENERKYKLLFENMQLGVIIHEMIFDKDGVAVDYKILDMNKQAAKIFSEEKKEMIGKTALQIFKDEKAPHLEQYEKVAREGATINFETYYESMNKYFNVIAYSTEPNNFITVFDDITENKELGEKKKLLEANIRNQQKLESIGTLASGVAHEINNPINGIMNYGQLIVDLTEYNSEINNYAKEIIDESIRISKITKNLLQFSRFESTAYEKIMIGDILSKTISLVNTLISKEQIKMEFNYEDSIEVYCRPQQIQQVVMNILTNARSALNEKYERYDDNKIIEVGCYEFIKEHEKWVRIIVEDHGSGIPKELQEKIFDPFFTTRSRCEGTGLGLSISHGIITEHKGELYFETEEGEYTKFFIELPCSPSL